MTLPPEIFMREIVKDMSEFSTAQLFVMLGAIAGVMVERDGKEKTAERFRLVAQSLNTARPPWEA